MKILLLILGAVAVALGLFLWDSRKKGSKTETGKSKNHNDKSGRPNSQSSELFKSPEAKRLKQSAATELGISVEQLERMSLEEIVKMATDRELI
jgi:FtsZ-interacting cell division protein ZipA